MSAPLIWFMHGYPDDAIVRGTGGGWTKSVGIFLSTINGTVFEDISDYFVSGYVDWDDARQIKTAGQLTIHSRKLKPYSDYIVPVILMEREDRLTRAAALGVFSIGLPEDAGDDTGTERTYFLQDLTQLLKESVLTKHFNVTAGTDYNVAGKSVVNQTQILKTNIATAGKTVDKDFTINAGTDRFEASKQLFEGGGNVGPYAERDGTISVRPPLRLSQVEPFDTWTGDQIWSAIRLTPNPAAFANVVVVTADDPNGNPISARAYDRDSASPGSVTRLEGREKAKTIRQSTAKSLSELQDIANRERDKASSYYRVASMGVELNPLLGIDEVVKIVYKDSTENYGGKWWVKGWRMPLEESDGLMSVTLNQLHEFQEEE